MIKHKPIPVINLAGDLRLASRAVGERDFQRVVFDNPQMQRVFHRISALTAGRFLPGLSGGESFLDEVIRCAVVKYTESQSTEQMIVSMSCLLKRLFEIRVHAIGRPFSKMWNPLDESLADFLSSYAVKVSNEIHVFNNPSDPSDRVEDEVTSYQEGALLIASRVFDVIDLERAGLVHKEVS